MKLINRVTPFLFVLTVLFGFEAISIWPKLFWVILVIQFLWFLLLWKLQNLNQSLGRFNPLLSVLFLNWSGIFFLLFVDNQQFRQIFIIFLTFITWLYVRRPFGLKLDYINLIIAFFVFFGFFSLKIFLNQPMPQLLTGVFLTTGILLFQIFSVNQLPQTQSFIYSLAGALILAESFGAISFLPTGYYVNSVALLAIFYAYTNLALAALQLRLTTGNILKFVLISGLSLVFVFATAIWS